MSKILNDPQKLIDLIFTTSLAIHKNSQQFNKMTSEEVTEWIRIVLSSQGIFTIPSDNSLGIITTWEKYISKDTNIDRT